MRTTSDNLRMLKAFHNFYTGRIPVVIYYLTLILILSTAYGTYRDLHSGGTDDWIALECFVLIIICLGLAPIFHQAALSKRSRLQEFGNSVITPKTFNEEPRFFTRVTQLLRRLTMTVSGAAKADLLVDLLRNLGILGLVIFGVTAIIDHRALLLSSNRFLYFVICLGLSVSFICFHAFVYPFFKGRSRWDRAYTYRKMMMANAINAVTATLLSNQLPDDIRLSIRKLEDNSLNAIRSYIENIVLDRKGHHLNVNLIVKHPQDRSLFVCIRRTSRKPTPTFYKVRSMPTAEKVFREGKPIYINDFRGVIDQDKKYRMVWQVPINSLTNDRCIGLLGVDSSIPHHLDLVDNRETLLFHITPYIALLRYSLTFREQSHLWDDVLVNAATTYLQDSINQDEPTTGQVNKYLTSLEPMLRVDRNVDEESLNVFAKYNDLSSQLHDLKVIARSIHNVTKPRKIFSILFPFVDANTRRFRV